MESGTTGYWRCRFASFDVVRVDEGLNQNRLDHGESVWLIRIWIRVNCDSLTQAIGKLADIVNLEFFFYVVHFLKDVVFGTKTDEIICPTEPHHETFHWMPLVE